MLGRHSRLLCVTAFLAAMALGIADRPWPVSTLAEAAEMVLEPLPGRRVGRFRVINGGVSD